MNVEQEFDKQIKDIEVTNIMVVGGTGVGKSSLINAVFGQQVAEVGAGEPITKGVNPIKHPEMPIEIFDTEGYELIKGEIDNSNFQQNVISYIKERKNKELKNQIHLFWYCLSVANHRLTDYDIQNIKTLSDLSLNLAIVFTQCDSEEINTQNEGLTSKEFRRILKDEGIDNICFETMVLESNTDHLELEKLLEWSVEKLPTEKLKDSFIGAQKLNIGLKEKKAIKAIYAASAAATTAAGLNPIPVSDSLALVPIQTGLAVTLAKIYGFNSLGAATMSLLKTQVLSLVGRQAAASLTKLIPMGGQLINGAVAGGITLGLGYALNGLYKHAYLQYLETGQQPDWVGLFEQLDLTLIFKQSTEGKI